MPFTGELITCVVCGAQYRSNPNVESDWRAIQIEDEILYACPNEFPPDGAGKEAFTAAYELFIACGLHELITRDGKAGHPHIEAYRLQR